MIKMTTRSTTLATWAGAIASALEHRGLDSQAMFARVGLDIAQTQDPDARYLVTDMTNLWHSCVAATGDPAFGLAVPNYRSATTFHGMGVALEASATLYESLQRLTKLSCLVSNVAEMKLYQRSDKNWLLDWCIAPALRREVADEAMDAFLASLACHLGAGELVEVFFVRAEPGDTAPWRQAFFHKPIHFSAGTDALVLTDAAMQRTGQPGNPALARAGETVAMDYLQKLQREDVVLQVENQIRRRLAAGEPKQQDVAAALHLSVRQLQRRLSARGISFARLLQEIRRQLAKEYLADSKRSIVDISLSLGFSDQSNFAAAFRRWQGVSPTEFRSRCTTPDLLRRH